MEVSIEIEMEQQGYHDGQGLRFVDFIVEIPQSWPTAIPFLPNLQLPEQNWADSGTTKSQSTKPSL